MGMGLDYLITEKIPFIEHNNYEKDP